MRPHKDPPPQWLAVANLNGDKSNPDHYNLIIIDRLGTGNSMENKTARLTVLIDPVKKKALEELCASQDLTPSQVVRQLIRDYLEAHDVSYSTKSNGK